MIILHVDVKFLSTYYRPKFSKSTAFAIRIMAGIFQISFALFRVIMTVGREAEEYTQVGNLSSSATPRAEGLFQ